MKKIAVLVFTLFSFLVIGQNNEQNIRGTIIDKLSKTPLGGVKVEISSLQKVTFSDSLGNYSLTGILPDRYEISISFFDYKDVFIPNVVVTTGKEVIVDIEMEEVIYKNLNEVVVNTSCKTSLLLKKTLFPF